jgi:hypothetical protein
MGTLLDPAAARMGSSCGWEGGLKGRLAVGLGEATAGLGDPNFRSGRKGATDASESSRPRLDKMTAKQTMKAKPTSSPTLVSRAI